MIDAHRRYLDEGIKVLSLRASHGHDLLLGLGYNQNDSCVLKLTGDKTAESKKN